MATLCLQVTEQFCALFSGAHVTFRNLKVEEKILFEHNADGNLE